MDEIGRRKLTAWLVPALLAVALPAMAQEGVQQEENGVGVYVAPAPVDLFGGDLDKTEPLMGLELANIVRRLTALEAENEILRNRILAVETELARNRKE